MKTIIITIAAIIALSTTAFGKTRYMTKNQYNLHINKIDSSVVGTWEKNRNSEQRAKDEFCQFNTNGTFITYKKESGKYKITGRGNWMAEKGIISIFHGKEKTISITYKSNGSQLVFGDNILYTKPAGVYAYVIN